MVPLREDETSYSIFRDEARGLSKPAQAFSDILFLAILTIKAKGENYLLHHSLSDDDPIPGHAGNTIDEI